MSIRWSSLGNGWVAPHFRRHELECPCCGLFIGNIDLLVSLEKLREALGEMPMHILSGARCMGRNEAVGGAIGSKHLTGLAADIVVQQRHPEEVAQAAGKIERFSHGGIGVYAHRGFVHLDVRCDGPARWRG